MGHKFFSSYPRFLSVVSLNWFLVTVLPVAVLLSTCTFNFMKSFTCLSFLFRFQKRTKYSFMWCVYITWSWCCWLWIVVQVRGIKFRKFRISLLPAHLLSTGAMIEIIIWCSFFFLSIGQQPTMWPANNCLQIMICSCIVLSKHVLLQIIFCSCVIQTTFSKEKADCFPELPGSD